MNNCTYPWTGMVISPQGHINLCCVIPNTTNIFNKNQKEHYHISKVDSLMDFFNGEEYDDVRKRFTEKPFQYHPECESCTRFYNAGKEANYTNSQRWDPSINKLQYLEFTASNVCNQQCVMCSSYYSNQWLKIDHMFNRSDAHIKNKTHILTDKDIAKIIECLPHLKELEIKGGEPFADARNYDIMKKLFEVNDECIINVLTNGSLISKKYIDLIKANPERFTIHASIDATGKRYEWIRGTQWEKTDETLKKLYYECGVKSRPVPTLSIYNIYDVANLDYYFIESEYINTFGHRYEEYDYYSNYVEWPGWSCHKKVLTQYEIDLIPDLPFPIKSQYNEFDYEQHIKYTKVMNKIRGFDINIRNDME